MVVATVKGEHVKLFWLMTSGALLSESMYLVPLYHKVKELISKSDCEKLIGIISFFFFLILVSFQGWQISWIYISSHSNWSVGRLFA